MSKVRQVQTFNKSVYTSMSQFEPRRRENGKTTLGTGSFGSVQLNCHISTNTLFAIKIIQGNNITTPYEVDGIEREIKVHSKCVHPNIVKLYDSFQENDSVYIVLEYVSNGNLYNFIQKKKKLDEKEACKFFIQTCNALQYLHDNNVFHRDIKPENLLIDANNNLKLCDFGWCAENIHLKRKTFCGTYEYMAPEIVSDQAYDYTIDIWSVGVLLYELLHGYAPFKGKEYKEIAANIKAGIIKYGGHVSSEAQELINLILQKDHTLRPNFQKIYNSSFVQKNWYQSNQKFRSNINLDEGISPRVSSDNVKKQQQQRDLQKQVSISQYQSPFQHQQPKGRKDETNNESNSEKSPIINNESLKNIVLKHSPTLIIQPTYKLKQVAQSFETKQKKSPDQIKLLQESKSCKSNIQNVIDEVKKKIDFNCDTPLKDNINLQNNSTQLTFLNKKNILAQNEDSCTSINYLRKKTINTTSFFCNSTQNSAKKSIFQKPIDKKAIPKSQIMLQSTSSLFKNIRQQDKKLTIQPQQQTQQQQQSNLKLNKQQSTSTISKLNLKSKSGYYAIHNDENQQKESSQKKITFTSKQNTARKDCKKQLDQYVSLPSEITVINHREDQFYHLNDDHKVASSDRLNFSNEPQKLKGKNDFDSLLKMYMNLCYDNKNA